MHSFLLFRVEKSPLYPLPKRQFYPLLGPNSLSLSLLSIPPAEPLRLILLSISAVVALVLLGLDALRQVYHVFDTALQATVHSHVAISIAATRNDHVKRL